jgi:hypothetical protein
MALADVDGVGRVWVNLTQVRCDQSVKHPPFSEGVRALLREIKASLDGVCPKSIEAWEEGFRQDAHPENEIAIWLRIARCFARLTSQEQTPAQRKDYFALLLACSMSTRESVLETVQLDAISRARAKEAVAFFYESSL